MTDRVKQLETAIEKALRCMANAHYEDARIGLRAALTTAEKVPTCPKCGEPLCNNPETEGEAWRCTGLDCLWQQPDSAQRPKMPDAKRGFHATEWRYPKENEHWFSVDGSMLHGWTTSMPNEGIDNGKRWIAVPDAPVSEPVVRCPVCNAIIDHRSFCNQCGRINTPVKVPSPPPCLGCKSQIGVDRFVCRLGENTAAASCHRRENRDAESVSQPEVKVPVVEYWRHPNSADFSKTVDGIIAETVGMWGNIAGEKLECLECLKTPVSETEYLAAKKAEESARKPAKPAIEPLGNYPTAKQMRDKMQEVIARVNALEGGAKC